MCREHVVSHLNGEEIVGSFYGKGLQETNQREFRVAKVIKNAINHMLNGKAMIILLTVELRKNQNFLEEEWSLN